MDLYARIARARAWIACALFVALETLCSPGTAQTLSLTPAQQKGVTWLVAQVASDGSMANESNSIATPFQARQEALITLRMLGSGPSALVTAVVGNNDTNSEYVARRIIAEASNGQSNSDDLATLLALQNSDGGWGLSSNYQSDVLDTSLALQALGAAKGSSVVAAKGFGFFAQAVNDDGGWGISGSSSVYHAANVLIAASVWSTVSVSTASTASNWLLNARNALQDFGNAFDNAVALLAIETQAGQGTAISSLATALNSAQLSDGSWSDDPYITALALRALWYASAPPVQATTGDVIGSVIDQASAQPISGALVELAENAGISTATGSDGTFHLGSVPPSTYTLQVSLAGYQSRTAAVQVVAGQTLDAGTIGLLPISTTASLSGIVKDNNGQALQNVIVAVGSKSTLTDSTGAYQILGIIPGSATITATLAGYKAASASVSFVAGTNYVFSPTLYPTSVTPPPTSLQGLIVDGKTGLPIAGASVVLKGVTQLTDTAGKFAFAGVTTGNFSLTVAANGYQGVTVSGTVATGVNDIGAVPLQPNASTTTLEGYVLDSVGNPISAAAVAVENGPTDVSDDTGAYQLTGIVDTQFAIHVSAVGYIDQTFVLSVMAPGTYTQDFQLVPVQTNAVTLGPLTVAPMSAGANANVSVSATLVNGGTTDFDGVLLLEVYDSNNDLIGSGALTDTAGFSIGEVLLQPGDHLGVIGRWNTGQFAPDGYRFEIRLVQPNSLTRSTPLGTLIMNQFASFTIVPATHFTGTVAADPPVIQAGLNQSVDFTAVIKNDGNIALAAQPMKLTVSDAKSGVVAFTASTNVDGLDSNALATPDFGSWIPTTGGNYQLTVTADDPSIGSITGSLYVGNVARATFTANPDTVIAGTRSVHGNIHVSGVDPAQATITDPLAPLIKTAIQNAVTYNDKAAHAWADSHRCTSCHISNQALIGGELTRNLATFDALDRGVIINNISTNQAADGGITAGGSPSYRHRLGSLTLWGLLGYHDPIELRSVIKRAADWVVGFQTTTGTAANIGSWSSDYNGAWFDNSISMSLLNLSNLRRTDALLRSNSISTVPTYAVQTVVSSPVSSRGFLAASLDGNLYYTDLSGASVNLVSSVGTLIKKWTGISDPRSIVVRQDGQVWVCSTGGTFRLNADGTKTLLASDNMSTLAIDPAGTVWGIKTGDTRSIYQLDSVTAKATPWLSAGPFSQIARINPSDDGTLYVTDGINGKIYQVMPDKSVKVITEVIQGNQSLPALIYLLKDGDHWLLSTSNGIYRFSADWVGHRITWSRADQLVRTSDGSVLFVTYQQAGIRSLSPGAEDVGASLANYAAAMDLGAAWLQKQSTTSTDNMHSAQQLWGLGEAYRYYLPIDAARAQSIFAAMTPLETRLRANQNADGGWGKVKGLKSDALVTAQTGIALDYLNPSAGDPAIRKAVAWLLSQQQADGSWMSADNIMSTHVSTTTMVAIWLPMILDRLGAIDAQVSVTFPANIQPASILPAPTQSSTDGAGNVLASWSLTGVTDTGVDLGFDLTMLEMLPNEVRPAASDAHMTFNNSVNHTTVDQPIDIPDVTATAPVTLTVATNQPDYPANATAIVTTTLVNLDDVEINGTLIVNVYDASGVFVGGVTQEAASIPARGTLPVARPFAIGTIIPAQYTVTAVLGRNSLVLAQGQTVFNVLPDIPSAAATSTVHTDKQVYNPSDHVQIFSHVESISANTILDNLSLKVNVYDASNTLQHSHAYAIAQLLPGQELDFTAVQTLTNAPPELYAVKQDLFDDHGHLINHVETAYNVSSTSDTGFGLTGTIAAAPKTLPVGGSLSLTASATNQGNGALTNLPLTITIVEPNQGTVLQQFNQTSSLEIGATVSFNTSWITKGNVDTTYYAVLTAAVGSGASAKTLTLAVDTFQLTLKLDANVTLRASKPPLAALVLVDPSASGSEIARMTATLASLNYAATFTNTSADFAGGVRAGAYQLYLLLSSQVAPDATTLRLLREAVHRGEGVVSANGAAELPDALAQLTGLTPSNALPMINAQTMDVLSSAPGAAASVPFNPPLASRIVVPQLAQTQAVLTGRLPATPDQGSLSTEVANLGRVDIGYFGVDTGANGSHLSLASMGRIHNADGSDRLTVWRIRNSGDTERNLSLASISGGYVQVFAITAHTDTFVVSPVVAGTADHRLSENAQTIQTVAAPAGEFSDSRLVDAGDNPGAIALWANQIGMLDVLDWTGSQHQVHGAIHSNSDIRLAGAQNVIDGPVHYVTAFTNTGSQNTFTFQPRQVEVQPLPTLLNLDDFKPGGPAATAAGAQYFDASAECASSNHGWQRNASQMPLPSGVYWIPCDTHISGGTGSSNNVTLVSTGAMQIDGVKGVFQPFYQGLQFATTSQSAGALQLAGDSTQIGGVVFAPNGTVQVSGSSLNLQCSVIGNQIRLANAKTTIDVRQCAYATVQRQSPAVLLNAFGDGWGAYAAFDWQSAIAQYDAAGIGELSTLFGGVLGEVATTQNPLRAGTIVALTASVKNNNDAFKGTLALAANDDSNFVPPMVSWALDFTTQSTFQAQSHVRLGSGSSTDINATVAAATPIIIDPLAQSTATITHLPGESVNDLIVVISAIGSPDAGLTAALADLQAAASALTANDREGELQRLLDAAEACGQSTNAEAEALRTRIDWVIWAATH